MRIPRRLDRRIGRVTGANRNAAARALAAIGVFGVVVGALLTLVPAPATAAINNAVNFQGKMVNTDGTNITNGTYNVEFRIFTGGDGCVPGGSTSSPCGGSPVWTEDWLNNNSQGVNITDGLFQLDLGSITSLPNVFNTNNVWLSVNLGDTGSASTFAGAGGDGEMLPFIHFTAAPYAINSDMLGGLHASDFAQLSPGSAQSGFLNVMGNVTSGATVSGVTVAASTGLQAPLLDAASAVTLNIGTATASAVTIGRTSTPFLIQGNSSSTFTATSGANKTTLAFATPTANTTLNFPASAAGTYTVCTTDIATCGSVYTTGGSGSFLARNSADTSSAAITASNYLYGFTNSSSAVAGGVLELDNGSNTGNTLYVTASGNPGSGSALFVANNTAGSPSGNLLDLQKASASEFSVDYNGNLTQNGGSSTTDTINGQRISSAANFTGTVTAATSLLAPLVDTASAGVLAVGTNNATEIDLNQNTKVAAGKNVTFASGAGNFDQSASTGTFGTGTGSVGLNGNTTVASNKSFSANGAALFQDATNSATAFQIQNSAGSAILVGDTTDTNLILNPGGEVASGFTTSWPAAGFGSNAAVSQDSSTSWNGAASVKVVVNPSTANAGALNNLGAALTTATQYTLSFYAKLKSGDPAFSDISAQYLRDGSTNDASCGSYNTQAIVSTGWTRITCTFTTSSTAGNSSAAVAIYQAAAPGASRTFWLDGVQLEQTAGVVNPYGAGNLKIDAVVTSPVAVQNTENSTTALQVVNAAGTTLFNADTLNSKVSVNGTLQTNTITPTGALTVGATGQSFTLQGNSSSTITATNGGNTTTIGFTAPTGARSVIFPDEGGTVCFRNSANCGFAVGSGTSFLQGGNSFGAAGDLGTNDGNALNIRTNGSTKLTVSTGGDLTFAGGGVNGSFDQSASTGTLKTGTGNVSLNGNTTVASNKSLTANGTSTFQNATDSTTGFQLLASSGANLLTGNTQDSMLTSAANFESTGYYDNGVGGIGLFGNLLVRSEQFENGSWAKTNLSTTTNAVAAPDGQTTAEQIHDTSSGGKITQDYTAAGNNTYTFSVWLKTGSGTQNVDLRIDSNGTPGTGTARTWTATTTWQRFFVTQTFSSGVTTVTPSIFPGGTGGSDTVNVYAWGGQLVQASNPEVYVRSVNAIVAASAGVVSNGGNFVSSANAGDIPIIVQGAASQTGDLIQAQDSNGASLFRVTAAGAVITASGAGLTATGTINLNDNFNANTNINTGTSTGTVTIGGGSAPLVIDSTNFDVSSAGALSGITTIATSSTINGQTISAAANFTGTVNVATGLTVAGGQTLLKPASDSLTTPTLLVQTTTSNNLLTVAADSSHSRLGFNLGGSNLPTLSGSGVEINGALQLDGGSTPELNDNFITPAGSTVATKILIPVYNPGNFGQIVALGINSSSASPASNTARAITLFDQRGYQSGSTSNQANYTATPHQPTLAVLSPDENQLLGLSWEGLNNTGYLKTSADQLTLRVSSSTTAGLDAVQIINSGGNASVGIGRTPTTYALEAQGSVMATTSVLAPVVDAAASGALDIGKTSSGLATSINLNQSTTVASGKNLSVNNGTLTVGSAGAGNGALVNNGSTVNTSYPMGDLSGGGWDAGGAAATVDKYTYITANQTSTGQTLTPPTPTANTTYGRVLYITNGGTASFTLLGSTLSAGSTATLIWSLVNSTAKWTYAGADGNSILNQNSSTQTANFRINGTGEADTSLLTALLDTQSGTTTLNVGTNNATAGISLNQNTTVSGTKTFTVAGGLTTLQAGVTVTGAAANINASSNFATNINTGNSTGAVTIGNTLAGAVSVQTASTVGIMSGSTGTGLTVGNTTSNPTVSFLGSGTFDTTTGTVSLNGNTSVTGTKTLTVAGGLTTLQAGLTETGGAANLNASSNFATNINTGTSTGAVTIGNTLAGAISVQSATSISLGTGTTSTALNFGNTTSNPTVGFNGSGTFDTTTGAVSLNGNTSVTGTKTFTVVGGLATLQAGLTVTGAAANLNASSNFATNINTGTSTGAVTIGNTLAGALSLQTASTVGIMSGTTGTGLTVGNTTSNPTVAFVGSGTFDTTTGAVGLNGNTTVASGKSLTALGNVTVGTAGGTTLFKNNGATQNVVCAYTGVSGTLALTTAGKTVNDCTSFTITDTGATTISSIASPTAGAGSIIYINNLSASTSSITALGQTVPAGNTITFIYDGTNWTTTFSATGSIVKLQDAYNNSAGAAPSILETSANKAVTVQSAISSGISSGNEVFGVHDAHSSDTIGNSLFTVNSTGIGINIGGTGNPATTGDLTFGAYAGATTARTITVIAQPTAATGGNGLTVTAGAGNTSGVGGALTLQGGTGGNAADGGQVAITGGAAGGGNHNGGAVSLQGGTATGTGTGGTTSVLGGAPNATAGSQSPGGAVAVTGATGATGSGATPGAGGGAVTITSGAGGAGTGTNSSGGNAANVGLTAGNGGNATGSGTNGNGGNITLTAGSAGTGGSGGSAGSVTLQGSTVAVGASAGGGALFKNNGATLETVDALGDLASGSMGSAASTVDVYSAFTIAPTATGRTYTVQNPTSGTAGRVIYISNAGSNSFSTTATGMATVLINPNVTATLLFNGVQWTYAGVDSSNLQSAYNNTVGGTVPSIAVSTTKVGVTVQNSVTNTIAAGAELFGVRSAAANDITLGNSLLTVAPYTSGVSGAGGGGVGIDLGAASMVSNGGDLQFGGTANRKIAVQDMTTAATAGSSLTVVAAAGNTSGAGGALALAAGAGGNAANGGTASLTGGAAGGGNHNGGGATVQGGAATGTGTGGTATLQGGNNAGNATTSNGGAVAITGANGAGDTTHTVAGGGGGAITVTSGSGGSVSGGGNLQGGNAGDITLTAGSGGASTGTAANSNGGNILLSAGTAGAGGSGTAGTPGVVSIATPVFTSVSETFTQTGNNQTFDKTSDPALLTNLDSKGTIVMNVSGAFSGATVTMPSPTNASAGRVVYVSAATGSVAFTLAATGMSSVNMSSGNTATLVWNGSAWSGTTTASSLQQVYNNTSTAPASIITTSTTKNILFQAGVGDDNANLFQVGNSLAAPLLHVDSTNTATGSNVANNSGVETGTGCGGAPTGWTAFVGTGSTVSVCQNISASNLASGLGSLDMNITTTGSGGAGVNNDLNATALSNTAGIIYNVSFNVKVSAGTAPTLAVQYFKNNTDTIADSTCTVPTNGTPNNTSFFKYTCYITNTSSTKTTTNRLRIVQTDTSWTGHVYIDNLYVGAQTTTGVLNSGELQVGGPLSQGLTIFQLDSFANDPISGSINQNMVGSMYYSTTLGRIQCYESDGWGSCGAAPDSNLILEPEYGGAVLNPGPAADNHIGTMTANVCSAAQGINATICSTSGNEFNYYQWTTSQVTSQTYSIYVKYQLPPTFGGFLSTPTLAGRATSTTDADVAYSIFQNNGSACGSSTDVTGGGANTWFTITYGTNPNTSCSFAAGDLILFRVDMSSKNNADAYAGRIQFSMKGK